MDEAGADHFGAAAGTDEIDAGFAGLEMAAVFAGGGLRERELLRGLHRRTKGISGDVEDLGGDGGVVRPRAGIAQKIDGDLRVVALHARGEIHEATLRRTSGLAEDL